MPMKTIGEVNITYENLLKEIKAISEAVKENTKITQEVLVQATRTNGRATELERINKEEVMPLINDYKENRARIRGAISLGAIVGTAILAGMGMLGKLYLDKVKKDVTLDTSQQVMQELERNYPITITK